MIVNYEVIGTKLQEIWPLEEVKNYLRIAHDYDDALILNLKAAAIEVAENFTGLSLHSRQINCSIQNTLGNISLKYIPILEVKEVSLLDEDNKKITDDFGYIETDNQVIHFKVSYIGRDLKIQYIAGFLNSIPRSIQHGILMHIASMYEHSEYGTNLGSDIKNLYIPYRTLKI